MKLATTTGELTYFTNTFEDAIRFYKDTGFKHLDFNFYNISAGQKQELLSDSWKDFIIKAKNTADELGFDFVQAHAPFAIMRGKQMEEGLTLTKRAIKSCGILGIKNMVIHTGCYEEFKYPDGRFLNHKANEPFLRELIPLMEENDVSVLFENTTKKHINGCYFPITADDLNEFVAFMNHPLFGTAWDVGHAHMDEINHRTEINKMKNTLKAVHIHDNNGIKDLHLAPFMGNLDFDSVIQGLIDIDFKGYFTFECDGFLNFNRNVCGDKLSHPTLEVKKESLKLLFHIGKSILNSYGIFEE